MGKGKEQQPNEPAQAEDPNDPKNMKPACACCCGPSSDAADLTPEHLQDTENFFGNRSCTDCCMVVLYAIFLIGWIIVIALAVQFGKPDRIIKPDNYRGDICGDGRLEAYPNYFVPLPSRSTYGICVAKCPEVGDVVCNNDVEPKVEDTSVSVANHYYDQTKTQFGQGLKDYATCKASNCDSTTQASADRYIATQLKLKQKKCFVVFYPSAPSLFRCIPGKGPSAGSENITLQSLANETAQTLKDLANTFGVGSFFTLGFSEIEQTWRVILICSFTCMGVALVWVLLLRWILAPIVYFVIVLILGVLIGLGFVFKWFVEDLEEGALPGEEGVENQIKLWKAAEWASFLLAAIYFGVMLHMLQRIRIAIAVMKEASKAFTSAPSMVLIPCITFIMLIGWIAWFIVTTIYIQTMGSEAAEAFNQAATDLLGENLNISALIASNNNSAISSAAGSASSIPVINISNWATLPQTKVLHLYNFFGVLWTGNICLMFGFMTMAMTVCSWYFSATQIQLRALESEDAAEKETGKDKQTVPFAVARAAWCTFWKHLGTVIWGALLIAIIQFIRAIFTYIAENYLKEAKDNWAAKVLIRIAECCLWYIEQVVKLISKNAYIITAIRNTSFCVSAFTALKLLLCNAARFVILSMLSAATIFLIKLFIVGINIFIAFGLLKENSLTNDKHVESGLFPIFLITIMSFVIASLFLNVYEACIDTIFLCFLVDEEEFKGKFMPQSLESIVKVFEGADIARREYEKNVRQAMIKAEQSAEAGSK